MRPHRAQSFEAGRRRLCASSPSSELWHSRARCKRWCMATLTADSFCELLRVGLEEYGVARMSFTRVLSQPGSASLGDLVRQLLLLLTELAEEEVSMLGPSGAADSQTIS